MTEPAIRTAARSDAPAIAAIYSESILARDSTMDTEPVSATDVDEWLQKLSPRETILVADVDGTTIGWGIVKKYSERPGYALACETSVYLSRASTGMRIGSLIQSHLMDFCRRTGYHHVVAKIWSDNVASIALHRRFGFSLVGHQREIGHIDGRWIDVSILQAILTDDSSTEGA